MTQLNIWGQIALMVEKIQNRRDHLASLTAAAKIHQEDLETMEEALQKELASLEKAQDLFEKAQKESDGAQGRVNFLQRSIALIRARPEINRIDETKVNLAKNKFARGRGATPVTTPVAGTKCAPLPGSAGSIGSTSSGSGLSRPSPFSSRSAMGSRLNLPLGGRTGSASSSDDEDDPAQNTNDKDNIEANVKGTSNTGDDNESKAGETVE
jgi:hypothetical protein